MTAECDQRDFFALPRLEAHRRAGGYIEAFAEGGRAIEIQCPIGLEEMIVAADLDGPVARVENRDRGFRPAGIQLDLPVYGRDGAWRSGAVGVGAR